MRGHPFAIALVAIVLMAGGLVPTASGQIVARRLNQPAAAKGNAGSAVVRGPDAQLAALRAANPGVPPAVLQAMLERARRWRDTPDVLGRAGIDWSPNANRRVGAGPPMNVRDFRSSGAPRVGTGGANVTRVALLRFDFEHDRGGSLSTGTGRFDLSGPDSTVPPIDRPPHNRAFYEAHLKALARYYDVQSYGQQVVVGDVWPRTEKDAYTLSDLADFGPWRFSQNVYPQAAAFTRDEFFAADSQARVRYNDPIPWDSYDRFILVHAGSDFQSDILQDSPEDPITFTIGLPDDYGVLFPGQTRRIDRAAHIPETASQDGFLAALNGVIAHESGHNMYGFADLYNIFTGYPVDGFWTLMDSGNNVGAPIILPNGQQSFATGLVPPSLDPFHRFLLTPALQFNEVTWGDTLTIANSERNADMRRLQLSSDEYLVLENRYISPGDSLRLDQDSLTRVILGPKTPDRFEYDALLPTLPTPEGQPSVAGGGILVWHLDASVIPFSTSLRVDPETQYGYNSEDRKGIQVVEADGLDDLGDPGSPFWLGSPYDPYFRSNNRFLSDVTTPNLRTTSGTLPHAQIEFLDDPGPTMRILATREWQLAGWPAKTDFPPGGPLLLAVDADGAPDHKREVCWAGGPQVSLNGNALWIAPADGSTPHILRRMDRRPRPQMAALEIGPGPSGPAYFAVSTIIDPFGGGQVWLIDHLGNPLPGWPATLPKVTTPPVIVGVYPNASVLVGCVDGKVYQVQLDGTTITPLGALADTVTGTLAAWLSPSGALSVAAGSVKGDVGVFSSVVPLVPSPWPRRLGGAGFLPDFLWIDFGDPGSGPVGPSLVVHNADRLWAFDPNGEPIPGWGRSPLGDTLVAGLGAGDPDGDGFPEVLTQTIHAKVAFLNRDGYPSPGWPRASSNENFRTASPALALDVDGDHRAEIVALDASGILAAFRADGHQPPGWPLATGSGATGSPVAADLDQDGHLDIVAPDRGVSDRLQGVVNGQFETLYAYSLPVPASDLANAWPMLGGDPGRTFALPPARTVTPPAPTAGPLVEGSLMAYPNPARRRPVSFAYKLTEPADVDFTILDASGHQVAAFTRSGRRSDNLEIWDPGSVPAGLYVARLRFRGAGTSHSEAITLGLLR